MTSKITSFDSKHTQMVHDAQLDYYGKRLATASSDREVRIFEVNGNQEPKLVCAPLKNHDGPVWQVSWAHPKFGMLLASCSYDGSVCVWKEQQANQWAPVYKDKSSNSASITSIEWAPHTLGLMLAAACSDGTVTVYTHGDDQQWYSSKFAAHQGGCNSVSWGPDSPTGSLLKQGVQGPVRQLVTGGCDNQVKVWRCDHTGQWSCLSDGFQDGHKDWVRDVAWAPSLGLLSSTIASCSEDKSVAIWAEDEATGQWKKSKEIPFKHKVWKVSWSPMGNVLAVSQGDNKVSLWKESVDGVWQSLSTMQDDEAEN